MGSPWGRYAETAAQVLGAGIALPACTVVGFLGGRWLGRFFGWGETAAYVGAALGVAAGFWNLVALVTRLGRPKGNPD
jgi:Putative F0F1-ATPase subunit Ca2+/Mg2+ transporter